MQTLKLAALCLLGISSAVQANDQPSAEEIRKVMNFYYQDLADKPVLVDFKLCQDIHREGPEKNNCKDEVHPQALTVNEDVYAWMNFMVPQNEKGEILVQLKHNGITRGIRQASVQGAVRYRTWRKIKLSRAGEWELPIFFENGEQVQEIDTVHITVHDALVSQFTEQ